MKKILSLLLVLSMMLTASVALAEGMGVQVIGGQDSSTQPVSLDDIQLESTVEVAGWGDITPMTYSVQDCVMVRKAGQLGTIWSWSSKGNKWVEELDSRHDFYLEVSCKPHGNTEYPWWCEEWVTHYLSQSQADFAFLTMDILNTTAGKIDYLKECEVKVVFDDNIEYAGWYYQRNMDLNKCTWIDVSDCFAIDPYYTGHYVFGCTLPNAVFNSNKPLRFEIKIDGNEIIYNVRK